eukprot:3589231-Pyramimonas_sp.AAC.1
MLALATLCSVWESQGSAVTAARALTQTQTEKTKVDGLPPAPSWPTRPGCGHCVNLEWVFRRYRVELFGIDELEEYLAELMSSR